MSRGPGIDHPNELTANDIGIGEVFRKSFFMPDRLRPLIDDDGPTQWRGQDGGAGRLNRSPAPRSTGLGAERPDLRPSRCRSVRAWLPSGRRPRGPHWHGRSRVRCRWRRHEHHVRTLGLMRWQGLARSVASWRGTCCGRHRSAGQPLGLPDPFSNLLRLRRRRGPVVTPRTSRNASSSDKGSTNGVTSRNGHDPSADLLVAMVTGKKDGVRAEPSACEVGIAERMPTTERHSSPSGNNAAIAGPRHDGPVRRSGPGADRRKEHVHIYMQEAEGSVRRRTAERVGAFTDRVARPPQWTPTHRGVSSTTGVSRRLGQVPAGHGSTPDRSPGRATPTRHRRTGHCTCRRIVELQLTAPWR